MKGYTFYAKNSGVEVVASKRERGNSKEGRITLRFFTLGDDTDALRFILTPLEAFGIHLGTLETATSGGKKIFTHKFDGDNGEVVTTLVVEKWERDSRSGYAMNINREDVSINVPMDAATFLYAGELMKFLSTEQAWLSYKNDDVETDPRSSSRSHLAEEDIPEPGYEEANGEQPVEKAAAGQTVTGAITAVRKDGQGFKMDNGEWYKINSRSLVACHLEKGIEVILSYARGERDNLVDEMRLAT